MDQRTAGFTSPWCGHADDARLSTTTIYRGRRERPALAAKLDEELADNEARVSAFFAFCRRVVGRRRVGPGTVWTPTESPSMRGFAVPIVVLALVASTVVVCAVKNGAVVPAYDRIDELSNPAAVTSWSGSSLVLTGGHTVVLPNIAGIVGASDDIARVVRGGVEVTAGGRVLVVVPVYSECDTRASFVYRTRRLKVDLSVLLVVLELADPDTALAAAEPWRGCWLHHARDGLGGDRPFRLGYQTHCELESVCARAGVAPPAHVERVFVGFRW